MNGGRRGSAASVAGGRPGALTPGSGRGNAVPEPVTQEPPIVWARSPRMSIYGINVPSPDEHDYHDARQQQRVQRAMQVIDAGDIIAIIESRLG
jgi:hypothetical protein